MKSYDELSKTLAAYRLKHPMGFEAYQFPNGLRALVSDGEGWEHVSVSRENRIPSWDDMCFIKERFWPDDEIVMQLHPAKKDYINNHPYVLHLWRPTQQPIPIPPKEFV